ncbi:unnamed protein product [Moneuplotes crassus]|uniref:Uncharacterized protein n=1 Tax=Euplotes crassus TaxID=5936 RepID=A0AAD1XSV0_EUPCR|nr:unnamed protein product [Moneuplotes crassus]
MEKEIEQEEERQLDLEVFNVARERIKVGSTSGEMNGINCRLYTFDDSTRGIFRHLVKLDHSVPVDSGFTIYSIKPTLCRIIAKVLNLKFTKNFNKFYFNISPNYVVAINYFPFEKQIMKILPKVIYEFKMDFMRISSKSFQKLVVACRHICRFSIWRSIIEYPTYLRQSLNKSLDFGKNVDYKIFHFDLVSIRYQPDTYSNAPVNIEEIVKAISECSLKDSLHKLALTNCGISQKHAIELTSKYDLTKFIIIGDKDKDDESEEDDQPNPSNLFGDDEDY